MLADTKDKLRQIIGWIGVAATVLFAGLWSYWGIVENFHEGWYSPSVWENIGMLFGQYLLITIVFCALGAGGAAFSPRRALALHCAWYRRGVVFQRRCVLGRLAAHRHSAVSAGAHILFRTAAAKETGDRTDRRHPARRDTHCRYCRFCAGAAAR